MSHRATVLAHLNRAAAARGFDCCIGRMEARLHMARRNLPDALLSRDCATVQPTHVIVVELPVPLSRYATAGCVGSTVPYTLRASRLFSASHDSCHARVTRAHACARAHAVLTPQ
jgi:hypothetical protein